MMLLVIDNEGNSAYIPATKYGPNSRTFLQADAIKDMSTGKIVKKSRKGFTFDFDAPKAKPLFVKTKVGIAMLGEDKAWMWNLGFQADNGFMIPDRRVLINYEVAQ